jgi:hypothetical protein
MSATYERRSSGVIRRLALGIFLAAAAVSLRATEATPDEVVVAHFGDSTCITSYLPEEQRIHALLNPRLAERYPKQRIVSRNVGLDGDWIRQFLDQGRYQRDVAEKIPRIDVALIRYGQNDWKKYRPEVAPFKKDVQDLCDRLLADYPGIHLVLESNTYIDPAHGGDGWMNGHFGKIWGVAGEVARERGYPFVDIYARFQREIASGHWDLSLRNQSLSMERFKRVIMDDSHDAEMKDAKNWFGDGHPNAAAVVMMADEEFSILTAAWPTELPRAAARTK